MRRVGASRIEGFQLIIRIFETPTAPACASCHSQARLPALARFAFVSGCRRHAAAWTLQQQQRPLVLNVGGPPNRSRQSSWLKAAGARALLPSARAAKRASRSAPAPHRPPMARSPPRVPRRRTRRASAAAAHAAASSVERHREARTAARLVADPNVDTKCDAAVVGVGGALPHVIARRRAVQPAAVKADVAARGGRYKKGRSNLGSSRLGSRVLGPIGRIQYYVR